MTVTVALPISADVLAHLDAQLASARRLLAQILRQSGAIRRRDVDGVLATMTDIQSEMASRGRLESERTELLWRAGSALGIPAEAVTLAELTNRALMRQELSFLEHLTRMLGGGSENPGYRPPGHDPARAGRAGSASRSALHVLDLEA